MARGCGGKFEIVGVIIVGVWPIKLMPKDGEERDTPRKTLLLKMHFEI